MKKLFLLLGAAGLFLSACSDSEQSDFSRIKKDAERGDARAQFILAGHYEVPDGAVKQNPQEAIKWYEKSAEQGYVFAQCYLGIYYNGGVVKPNYQEAVKWLKKAAEQGCMLAQYLLGCSYEEGKGVEKDEKKAFKLFSKLAAQGFEAADARLALLYARKDDSTITPQQAQDCLRKAAEKGDARAQFYLGITQESPIDEDPQEAFKWFSKAAEQGLAQAQYKLANYYADGIVVSKNPQEAAKWLKKAAGQGLADAQFFLGVCYNNGYGVEKNPQEAFNLCKKAAEQGHSLAQKELGDCYYKGAIVAQDKIKACAWYASAAKKGNFYADIAMEKLEKELSSAQIAEALKLSEKYREEKFD